MEYRRKLADYAVEVVKNYFQKEDYDEDDISNFVQAALSTAHNGHPDFIWKNFFLSDFQEVR